MPKTPLRITTRKARDSRARFRGEREVCANGECVATVAPSGRGDGWYFYGHDSRNRLPQPFNTLCSPFQGRSYWSTADDAARACVAFVREHLAPPPRATGEGE
jgi:hypothetical protein